MRRTRWSKEEDDIIRDSYHEGIDACVTRLAEGGYDRARDAVARRAQALGAARVNRVWTDAEDAIVRASYPSLGTGGTLDALREAGYARTPWSVITRAQRLGVARDEALLTNRWHQHEDDIIRELFPDHSTAEVQRALEDAGSRRTANAVNARAQNLGVRRGPMRRKATSGKTAMVNFIIDLVYDKDVAEQLAAQRNRSEYLRNLVRADISA